MYNAQYYGFYDSTTSPESAGGAGYARINNFFSGLLFVSFFLDIGGGYRVVDTDYTSYSIVYSCSDHVTAGIQNMEASWVLVRS